MSAENIGINKGLCNKKAFIALLLWYIFSTLVLIANKQIFDVMDGEPVLLTTVQMMSIAVYGYIQMYVTCGLYQPVKRDKKPPHFYRNMTIVGCLRYGSIFSGLVALRYVTASFTETIKSTTPIFTVVSAFFLTGERTGVFTLLSLVPIMGGLALCSAYELTFNIYGFLGAVGANLTECLLYVFAKYLGTREQHKYGPEEIQFYSGAASLLVQVPACVLMMDQEQAWNTLTSQMVIALILSGFFVHAQTISNFVLLEYISPVTHSVLNTLKRALMIWLSILWFRNEVTFLSGSGTVIVILGVFCYNKAREIDSKNSRAGEVETN